MRRLLPLWLVLLAVPAVLLSETTVIRPGFQLNPSQFLVAWDSGSELVLLYRNTNRKQQDAIARFRMNGQQDGRVLSPLRDFPDAEGLDSWHVAAGPGGATVIAGVVQYVIDGKRQTRHVILTYDSRGKLEKLWDVAPYHHHQIALDAEGKVYAFGHRTDAIKDSYPLLIEYSPQGRVLHEALPSTTFATGDLVVDSGLGDQNQLLIAGDEVLLFVREVRELHRFTKQLGSVGSRRFDINDTVAASRGGESAELLRLGLLPGGTFVAQYTVTGCEGKTSGCSSQAATGLIRADSLRWAPVRPPAGEDSALLLGSTRDGALLFMGPRGSDASFKLIRVNPAEQRTWRTPTLKHGSVAVGRPKRKSPNPVDHLVDRGGGSTSSQFRDSGQGKQQTIEEGS